MIASRYVEHASTLRRSNKQNEPKEDMDQECIRITHIYIQESISSFT